MYVSRFLAHGYISTFTKEQYHTCLCEFPSLCKSLKVCVNVHSHKWHAPMKSLRIKTTLISTSYRSFLDLLNIDTLTSFYSNRIFQKFMPHMNIFRDLKRDIMDPAKWKTWRIMEIHSSCHTSYLISLSKLLFQSAEYFIWCWRLATSIAEGEIMFSSTMPLNSTKCITLRKITI